ncbi:ABC transporter permease subunit [Chryseobacterium sp. 1B4]
MALWKAGKAIAVVTAAGLSLIFLMGLWTETMETLALIFVSTITALVLSIPLGILAAKSKIADKIIRPLLDLMQTMPAFVYLIPAVLFFSIGKVPGAFATIIFAMPPAVRLTSLGIEAVPKDIVEAARAFGATGRQILFKVELPLAIKTILTGINQTILLSLSMVVIAGMIAAGGLGKKYWKELIIWISV